MAYKSYATIKCQLPVMWKKVLLPSESDRKQIGPLYAPETLALDLCE